MLDPLNGTTGFTYDANGNLLSVTDARSNQTIYTYENMGRGVRLHYTDFILSAIRISTITTC